MITSAIKRLAWALTLLALQVLILDQVHPWGYGAPLVCSLIVITLPTGTSRCTALLWGFGLPFVVMVTVLVVVLLLTDNEVAAALGGLLALAPYYGVLYLLRRRLRDQLSFAIK